MFKIEPHNSEKGLLRQSWLRINVKTRGDNVPLKANWNERYCTLPAGFERLYDKYYDFEIRDDDVFLVTFPKSGSTWLQEATWLLLNNLDYEAAKERLSGRSISLDLSGVHANVPVDSLGNAKALKSPRIIKTHLPASLLPRQLWLKKAKIIYCARNYKDVAVSMFHFQKGMNNWFGQIDEYVEDFVNDDIIYTPYWPHVLEFWQMRDEPNIFFTTYEQMKRDLKGVLRGINAFLEQTPLSEEQLEELSDHLSFTKMKENTSVNPTMLLKYVDGIKASPGFEFMRRGIIGAYKDELTPVLQNKLEDWTKRSLENYKLKSKDIFGEF